MSFAQRRQVAGEESDPIQKRRTLSKPATLKELESSGYRPRTVKDELRAKLLATFMAPATDFVRTINAGAQNFMYLLSAKERAGDQASK